jgi:hypothetical protein
MIAVQLKGGLGNQIFQYALGRRLSIDNHCSLTFDARSYKYDRLRKFALSQFKCSINLMSPFAFPLQGPFRHLNSPYKRLINNNALKVFNESTFSFQPHILECGDGTYLAGYWQSEKYFLPIRDILLNDLQLSIPLQNDDQRLSEEISQNNSVSIHVRRGDYLTDSKTNSYHGLCDISWYQRAILKVINETNPSKFYIFSDDYEWVKSNLRLNLPTEFIKPKSPGNEAIDLHLMSLCKHNIIANSSFSWWAAWLNQNPNKHIVAPKNWFANAPHNTSSLIPSSWIQLL